MPALPPSSWQPAGIPGPRTGSSGESSSKPREALLSTERACPGKVTKTAPTPTPPRTLQETLESSTHRHQAWKMSSGAGNARGRVGFWRVFCPRKRRKTMACRTPDGEQVHGTKKKRAFFTTFLLLLFWPGIAGLQNSLHSCQPCRSRSLIPFFKKKNQDQGRASPAQKGPPAPCCAVSGSVAEASRGDGMEGEMVSSSKGIGVGIPCFPLPPQGHTGASWRSADHMGTCGRAKSPLR